MDLKRQIFKTELDGQPLSLEISKLANQTNASMIGRHGETTVLVTVVMNNRDRDVNYFPLTVDYEEKFYAVGKILGSRFMRREGRPSDEATLSARLIDRSIRPLFDHRIRREIQVVVTILAYDEKNDPDIIALLATSTALSISDIPWNGPIAGVKIVSESPNYQSFFAGSESKINMIEFEGSEVTEKPLLETFEKAQKEIKQLIKFQKDIVAKIGQSKVEIELIESNPKMRKLVSEFIKPDLEDAIREKKLADLKDSLFEHLKNLGEESEALKPVDDIFEEEIDHYVHQQALEHDRRIDGRKLDEVRDLYGEVGLIKRTHGSGLFIRGDTQLLAITTLAPPDGAQLIETMRVSEKKRFMLHYNFPNFSVGEVGRSRGPGRREIGHGTLAAKAVNAVMPSKEDFPYTIRVVAETLSSNGSSSMATVCATILSLMDAGVPIKSMVAGIAIGLMSDEKSNKFKILTDIQGPEDHHGDMDLKIAGTEKGVTAMQMDVKNDGITSEVFEKALQQGRGSRLQILKVMKETLAAPRPEVSPYAPVILTLTVPEEKIGNIIGPGGKTINAIIDSADKKVSIDIEQDGKVFIAGENKELAQKAYNQIKDIIREYKVGEIVEGKIIKILDFGAIMDLGGGRDGMIHVSELKDGYVKNVEEVLKMNDVVKAKVIKVESGRIGLSLKNL